MQHAASKAEKKGIKEANQLEEYAGKAEKKDAKQAKKAAKTIAARKGPVLHSM